MRLCCRLMYVLHTSFSNIGLKSGTKLHSLQSPRFKDPFICSAWENPYGCVQELPKRGPNFRPEKCVGTRHMAKVLLKPQGSLDVPVISKGWKDGERRRESLCSWGIWGYYMDIHLYS